MYEPITLCSRCVQAYREAGKMVVPEYSNDIREPCDTCRCQGGRAYLIDRGGKPKKQASPPAKAKVLPSPKMGAGQGRRESLLQKIEKNFCVSLRIGRKAGRKPVKT